MPYKVAQVPRDKVPLDGLMTTVGNSIRFKNRQPMLLFECLGCRTKSNPPYTPPLPLEVGSLWSSDWSCEFKRSVSG